MYNARWPFSVVHQSSCQLNVDQGYKIDAFICMWCEPSQVPAQVPYTCTLNAVYGIYEPNQTYAPWNGSKNVPDTLS